MTVSFVVCCFNSAARLPATLGHLAKAEPVTGVGSRWEVVLVDNASTDDTVAVAKRCWSEVGEPAPLCVVEEPKPGLMHARRCGVHAARHEIVCFVDDDNWIGPDWPGILHEIFTSYPAVGAVGGVGHPVFEGTAPPWFQSVQCAYAVGPQAPRSGEVPRDRNYLYGAGLAIRRRALLDLYEKGFQPLLPGRQAANLTSGDDSELCFALVLAGWGLWYDSRLVFQHFITSRRLDPAYARRLVEQIGHTSALLDAYVLAGGAVRPFYWYWLNRWHLPRLLIASARYVRTSTAALLSAGSRDLARDFSRGRLRGVVASRRQHHELRVILKTAEYSACSMRRGYTSSAVERLLD